MYKVEIGNIQARNNKVFPRPAELFDKVYPNHTECNRPERAFLLPRSTDTGERVATD